MDTFFEQIVSIKKSGKAIALFLFVWILALILCALILLFGIPFAPVLVIGLGYGAWWLTAKLNVEYEYIVTNGTMDIDKIVNKSSRQRVSSFEIAKVERVEKYNPSLLNNVKKENLVFACNQNDPNAYLIVASREDAKVNYIVFSPNEKLQEAIKKSLPKFIANSAFK
ncbi:MAG: hypothetical protein J6A78_02890 [Clostridia bacterium]|nr:hypothetical protein [Oscillospiraceae bacterium]MBO5358246.1 hypothetical protein [Clostridia bacterium]